MKVLSQSRKCQKCNTWNYENDYCTNCNNLLNYDIQDEIEVKERIHAFENRPKEKADIFLTKVQNSRNPIVKGIYYVFYSIWFVFISIISFFMALIVLAPG